jgi:predicted GNAT family N-acyltransferase
MNEVVFNFLERMFCTMDYQIHTPYQSKSTSTTGSSQIAPKVPVAVKTIFPGDAFPKEYKDLRQRVYVEETKLVKDAFCSNDTNCSHLLCYENGELVASMTFGAAEDTDFKEWSGADEAHLKNAVLTTRGIVAPEHRGKGYYKFLLYSAMSAYRKQGRKRVVSYSEQGDTAIKRAISPNRIPSSKLRDVGGYNVECIEGDISFVMWKMFDGMPARLQDLAIKTVVREEIEYYSKNRIKDFYKAPFVKAVLNKTLTKQQYIEVQANTYCYVQWTTRILARLLTNLSQVDIFKEITHHLVEEDGHPMMVIDDMRACGATEDYINYVINGMVPNYKVDAFMVTQEAATAFRHDPIAFMGVPIGIEGVTAFMPPEFIKNLRELAKSWGVDEPAKATTFWGSHLIFDNPNNGHWARMIDLVREHITTERQVRQLLNYVDNVIDNISAGYGDSLPLVFE